MGGSRFDVLSVEENKEGEEEILDRNNTAVIAGEDMEIMEDSTKIAVSLGKEDLEEKGEKIGTKDESLREGDILLEDEVVELGINSGEMRKTNQEGILYGLRKDNIRKESVDILEKNIAKEQSRIPLNSQNNNLGLRGVGVGSRVFQKNSNNLSRLGILPGKENITGRAPNPTSVVTRRPDHPSLNHNQAQVSHNEQPASANHTGSSRPYRVLGPHRFSDGGANDGSNPTYGEQSVVAGEHVPAPGSQPPGNAGNSSSTNGGSPTNEGIEGSLLEHAL